MFLYKKILCKQALTITHRKVPKDNDTQQDRHRHRKDKPMRKLNKLHAQISNYKKYKAKWQQRADGARHKL